MIKQTLAALPGGVEHDTVYPAALNQDSSQAVTNVSACNFYSGCYHVG